MLLPPRATCTISVCIWKEKIIMCFAFCVCVCFVCLSLTLLLSIGVNRQDHIRCGLWWAYFIQTSIWMSLEILDCARKSLDTLSFSYWIIRLKLLWKISTGNLSFALSMMKITACKQLATIDWDGWRWVVDTQLFFIGKLQRSEAIDNIFKFAHMSWCLCGAKKMVKVFIFSMSYRVRCKDCHFFGNWPVESPLDVVQVGMKILVEH